MRVCVGGSFEFLHAGHRALLWAAAEMTDDLVIGLTSEAFMEATKGYSTPFGEREAAIEDLMRDFGYPGEYSVAPLDDPYGPALNEPFDAIVASEETANVARRIVGLRKAGGLPPMEVVIVPMVLADDDVSISSTRIRRGEIDLDGHLL